MRNLGLWGLGAVLLAGCLVSAAAAASDEAEDKPAPTKSSWDWLPDWNLFGKKDKPSPRPADAAKAAPEPAKPSPAEEAALRAAQERAKLMRRWKVCQKLKEIGAATGDADLQRLAEQLDDRAYAVYLQRTAAVPGSTASFDTDEQLLEKHLPTGAGSYSEVSSTEAGNRVQGGRAAREEKP